MLLITTVVSVVVSQNFIVSAAIWRMSELVINFYDTTTLVYMSSITTAYGHLDTTEQFLHIGMVNIWLCFMKINKH